MGKVIAVVGTQNSGATYIAGILDCLGVSMGRKFQKETEENPKGDYEAMGLKTMCNRICPQPLRNMELRLTTEEITTNLERHISVRDNRNDGAIGLKAPQLCLLIPELVKAAPELKIIVVDSDVAATAKTIAASGAFTHLTEEVIQDSLEKMVAKRDADLGAMKVETLKISLPVDMKDKVALVNKISDFIGIDSTKEQGDAAVAFVDPEAVAAK